MKAIALFLFAVTLAFSQTAFAQENSIDGQRGYLVGPGDVITIRVLNEAEFSLDLAVDEDGKIQLPYSEPMTAQCLNEKTLREQVVKSYSRLIKNPQVTVFVKERNSRPPTTIYGEVRAQQRVVLTRETRLLELLSFAGGVTNDAGGMIQIFRTRKPMCGAGDAESDWIGQSKDNTDVPSRMYSLTSVQQGREEANPVILPGDIIVVQRAAPVYITGEVSSPMGVYLKEGGLSLTEALAKIGGVRREAKTKDIKIYRLKDNSKDREIISVNYDSIKKGEQKDVMLQPYDIVEVDKSKKSIGQIIFETVTGTAKTLLTNGANVLPQTILY